MSGFVLERFVLRALRVCLCVRVSLTCDGEDHGKRGEGAGEPLAAHEEAAVLRGHLAHQAEQTALHHRPERWGRGEVEGKETWLTSAGMTLVA